MTVDEVIASFRRILETEEVTADSDFFASGGDSLLATRVLSGIVRIGGPELTIDDFLQAPTPATLAGLIAGAKS